MKSQNTVYYLLLAFILASISASAQSRYVLTYDQLSEYEGTYAFTGNTTLQIAASPKDTMLYALVGDSKYKLRTYQKDIFINGSNQEVHFIRNNTGIAGYQVKDQTPDKVYPLITKKVTFSNEMWFARGNNKVPYHWVYSQPKNMHDGIPTGSLINSGLDTGLIHTMITRIVNQNYNDVNSILIIKNGKLVLEEYFYGFTADSLHQLRSATKSFSSALVGIAVDKHLIKSTSEKLLTFYPEYPVANLDERKKAITIQDMLTQRSGFACDDDDGNSAGNENKIYPTSDWIKTMLDLPMINEPGKVGSYCSGNIMLLNRIVEKVSHQKLHDFAAENLFSKLGVKKFDWDFVPDQSHQESFGQVSLRPRDMAKFGMLYLSNGKWNGMQIISADWIKQSITKHSNIRGIDYGYLWWCEDLTANGKIYRGAAAKGNGGQRIFIWPDQNMIAVITAGNYNTQSPANRMLIDCVLGGLKTP
jgi:CubicO group peptidase (beta-lactamase class C family)